MNLRHPRHFYNDAYVAQYRTKHGEGRIERLLSLFRLRPTDEVLDVGCGSGFLYELIGNQVKSYTGLDPSENFIEECQQHYPQAKHAFRHQDLQHFAAKTSQRFDKIFLLDVTEHIYDQELLGMLQDCLALLKPHGQVYIHTPNATYLLEKLKALGIMPQVTGHIAVRSADRYRQLLFLAGFRRGTIHYLNHYHRQLQRLHVLSRLPLIGKYWQARLFLVAGK